MDKQKLQRIAQYGAETILESWINDYHSWDMLFMDEELSDEEQDYILENIRYKLEVSLRGA